MLAVLCPGQGAQTPGFLTPWLELPGYRAAVAGLGRAAGADLVTLGTTADAEAVRDTAVAQPLIVAASLASFAAVLPGGLPGEHAGTGDADDTSQGGDAGGTSEALDLSAAAGLVSAVAGHSVGEVAAAAIAGVLDPAAAMALVAVRGAAMARAAARTPTGMSAVVGGDPDEVAAAIAAAGASPANVNSANQVVAAGTLEQLAALATSPPARARVMPLAVAGAFHTEHMRPAVSDLAEHVASLHPRDPSLTLLSNADGEVVGDGADVLSRLVTQVSSPVRWDACTQTLADRGVTGVLELSPAGTLAGLAKRALRGVEVVALRSPDDLGAARDLVAAHGEEISAA